jgi:hypothetical protein
VLVKKKHQEVYVKGALTELATGAALTTVVIATRRSESLMSDIGGGRE